MTPSRAALARSDAKPATERPVRLMQRVYRDVGLSAVALELELSTPDLETEVGEAVKRGARYVYLAPKADRESQAVPRQPASGVSTDRGPPDASAAVPASLVQLDPAEQADGESKRKGASDPSEALPRQPASVISPARESSDKSVAAAARLLNLAPKADRETKRNDASGPTQALPRQPASAVSTDRGPPDASAAVPASLSLQPETVKRREPYVYLAPKADGESMRNGASGPSQALPRQPASAVSGPSDTAADAATRRVNLEPKADRESGRDDTTGRSQAPPPQPASAVSIDRGPPDASAAVPASLLQPAAVKRREPYDYLAPKADGESVRNGASGPSQALPRQPASSISPARGSSDTAAAAATRPLNLAAKADREPKRNDASGPAQALPRQPASAVSTDRGPPDGSAAVPASLLQPAPVKQREHYVYLAPKADGESLRNGASGPSQALPRQPASAIAPAHGSSDTAAAAARRVNLAPKADRESGRDDTTGPSRALPPKPASAVSTDRGPPDASFAAVLASLLGPEPVRRRAPYVDLAPKAEHESTRNNTSSPSPALPRQSVSIVSLAPESADASAAAVARLLNLAPKAGEPTRNDIYAPSQTLVPQPGWGLLLRRQTASAISPAPGSSDASATGVPAHVNLAPKVDRESRRDDIFAPRPALLRKPASTVSPARGSFDASAVAAGPQVDLEPKAGREPRRKDVSGQPQALLRRPASAVSPAWGLLLRRQPGSATSPVRGLPDARAAAVAGSLLGPSLAAGRAGSSSIETIRGEAGSIPRTGGEGRAKANKPSVEVPLDRFKRLDKNFWPLLAKN
jgi:hypothetical protein